MIFFFCTILLGPQKICKMSTSPAYGGQGAADPYGGQSGDTAYGQGQAGLHPQQQQHQHPMPGGGHHGPQNLQLTLGSLLRRKIF
jgi:hypothetical protein